MVYSYQLDIRQNAHKILGDAVIAKSGSNSDYIQDFNLEGETWMGYVIVSMRSKTRVNLSFVSGLFRVAERGRALKGSWSYRAFDDDDVGAEHIELARE